MPTSYALSAMHGHYYIHVISKSLSMKKSCIAMREHYATTNTDINGFRSPDQRHCPQIEECLVGIICGALPCLPMNGNVGYIENKCTRGITVIRYT